MRKKPREIEDLSHRYSRKKRAAGHKTWWNFSILNHSSKRRRNSEVHWSSDQWSDVIESRDLPPLDEIQHTCCHTNFTVEEVDLPHTFSYRCILQSCVLKISCQDTFVGRTKGLCQCSGKAAQEVGKCDSDSGSEHHSGRRAMSFFFSYSAQAASASLIA